ncbi:unnamed protein product, partial [marine sediment metagenome]
MNKHQKKGGFIFEDCLPLCTICPSSILILNTIFSEIGLFDETLPACEDYDLWLRLTAKYPVLYLNEKLTIKYGGHDDQLSKQYWGMDRFRIKALNKIIQQGNLSSENLSTAIQMMQHKIQVYLKGARKRNKTAEV